MFASYEERGRRFKDAVRSQHSAGNAVTK
jgi:hypothetical protein